MIQMLKCASTTNIEQQTAALILRHLKDETALPAPSMQDLQHIESFHWATRTYEKGCTVIAQGEARNTVAIVLSGWAFQFQALPDGKRQILDFVFAGALLGFGSGGIHQYGVETITTCVVASLQNIQFRRLLCGSPTLAIHVAERVAESEMRAHEHLTSLGRRTARQRVAALIVELMVRSPNAKTEKSTGKLELPITQIMIGDALGLSNEHVCRTLAKLADNGLIELSRHALRVLKPAALAFESGKSFSEIAINKAVEVWAA
jgi:CRP/FNR family transcriptional regulator, anaerobic regulatory protein